MMKFTKFEGLGSWIKKKFNKNEDIAQGILNKVFKLKKEDIFRTEERILQGRLLVKTHYTFVIDDFQIKISCRHEIRNLGRVNKAKYTLKLDGFELPEVSRSTMSSIYTMSDVIYRNLKKSEYDKETEDYTIRDARNNFTIND